MVAVYKKQHMDKGMDKEKVKCELVWF